MAASAQPVQYRVVGNGIERIVSRLHPNALSVMFRMERESIILIDAANLVCLWCEDKQQFEDLDLAVQPLTIEGIPLLSSPSMMPFAPVVPRPNFRPPVPPPFEIPGVVQNRVPPPGNRFASQSVPPASTKTLIVQRAARKRNRRPGRPLEMVHIKFTKEEASVPKLNEKLGLLPGFAGLILCNARGLPFPGRRNPSFWGFGRGGALNAAQYYALPPIIECSESDDEDDNSDNASTFRQHGKRQRSSLTSRDLRNINTTITKSLNANISRLLKPLLTCYWCDAVSTMATVCCHCGAQVGCYACVQQWLTTNNISNLDDELEDDDRFTHPGYDDDNHKCCPLCRTEWIAHPPGTPRPKPNNLGYIKLVGFTEIIALLE
uniref:RING-type domain-containing protein n=1 Tax=Plectus sambesii TaxID=2011161 RepID=A0A914W8K0_9BILA